MLSVRDLSAQRLCAERQALVADAAAALSIAPTRVRVRHELRYRGQSFELPVEEDVRPPARARGAAGPRTGANAMPDMPSPAAGLSPEELCSAFAAAHEQRYGYRDQTADIELVNMRASVWGPAPALAPRTADRAGHARAPGTDTRPVDTRPTDTRPVFFNGRALPTTILRGEPQPGTTLSGPALCALPDSTVLVPPGWGAEVDSYGTLLLRSTGPSSLPAAPPSCR